MQIVDEIMLKKKMNLDKLKKKLPKQTHHLVGQLKHSLANINKTPFDVDMRIKRLPTDFAPSNCHELENEKAIKFFCNGENYKVNEKDTVSNQLNEKMKKEVRTRDIFKDLGEDIDIEDMVVWWQLVPLACEEYFKHKKYEKIIMSAAKAATD